MKQEHVTVLLHEAVDYLDIKPDGIYIDGTLGRGGHSQLILSKLLTGKLYAFDKDQEAIKKVNIEDERFEIINADFRDMAYEMSIRNVEKVDGILLDIGVSSPQFDEASRGFSYRFDDRLDMRMDQSQALNAYEVVNTYSEDDLKRIFYEYGEEKYASSVAKNIIKYRKLNPIKTTFELVDIIKASLPNKELRKKGHPAKQVFQALRIEVNDELGALKQAIEQGAQLLNHKGRYAIITFHSLEDRIVKKMFNTLKQGEVLDARIPIMPDQIVESGFDVITRKPVLASSEELEANKRARSAKLRVLERD